MSMDLIGEYCLAKLCFLNHIKLIVNFVSVEQELINKVLFRFCKQKNFVSNTARFFSDQLEKTYRSAISVWDLIRTAYFSKLSIIISTCITLCNSILYTYT